MSARKSLSLRTAAAVLFTSVVAPVLVSMVTQELTSCQTGLHQALDGGPATTTAGVRPRVAPPPPATTGANQARTPPSKTPPGIKLEELFRAAASRGR